MENGSVRAPYPVKEFWLLAQEIGVNIITNSDAHRPIDVAAHKRNSLAFAKENNLHLSGWNLDSNGKLHIK